MKIFIGIVIILGSGLLGCILDINGFNSPPIYWLLGVWAGLIAQMVIGNHIKI